MVKMRLTCLVAVTLGHVLFYAAEPVLAAAHAVWVQPSGNWFGIDGDWSSFDFGVGAPMQHVELTVNTALSEIWVVQNTGCSPTIACFNARGGVFDPHESSSWQPLGAWDLGLKELPYGGNGDYGLETMVFTDTLSQSTTAVDASIVAAINSTDYYQGYLGLGINPGRFGAVAANPLIIQLAETYGSIPSHSYGYTAGASYAAKTPASLTLGGYDTLRYKPHDVSFHLDGNTHTPSVNLRGITVNAPLGKDRTTTEALLSMNESLTAIIDTSTPYLWLPEAVCDRFATELGLQWNETLGVYVFNNGSQYNDYLQNWRGSDMSFTFSVSSYDYLDDFAQPLALPGVVNITVPAAAFAHLLRYPFQRAIRVSDSSVPYFPLKRAAEKGPFIIGRAFMQAAYMILNYETGSFTLHEALFPDNPATNISITTIDRSPTSPYPAYKPPVPVKTGLKTPAIVGIVVAVALGFGVALAVWWFCRRRRKNGHVEKGGDGVEETKEETESIDSEEPRSPVRRMMSRIIGRRRSRKAPVVHEVHGNDTQPAEFAADATHEVYEMPVPFEPVELDSTDGGGTEDMTEFGTNSSHGLTPYELARRKLDRQLQGPVPLYTPASPTSPISPTSAKTGQDVSHVPHYRSGDNEPSPASSPTYANSNSMPNSLPSPMTPHPGGADWTNRNFDLPSPMTVAPPFPSPQFRRNDTSPNTSPLSPVSPNSLHSLRTRIPSFERPIMTSRSDSSEVSPVSPGVPVIPPAQYQRTPIDPSRVVCLGPLPENVQLPRIRPVIPRLITPDGRVINPIGRPLPSVESPTSPSSGGQRRRHSTSTLGSNFTEDEADHGRHSPTQEQEQVQEQGTDSFPHSPQSMERIDGGSELVHVPQLADKRYSWEDTR